MSHNPYTYGKRGSMKRKDASVDSPSKLEPMPSMEELRGGQKRRKLTASPEPRKRTPSPPASLSDNGSDIFKKVVQEKPLQVYGTPRKKIVRTQSDDQASKTPVRDFSQIFDAVLPSSSQQSPSKLAKRMLARSKTESSIDSPSTSQQSNLERTVSLPAIPPSPSKLERHASTSAVGSPAIRHGSQKAKSSVTKTYAGAFRSFLVPLPSSQDPGASQSGFAEEDDFDSRESYNSLRTRWGVDNSEDDPYNTPPTTSKSQSQTPEGSPTKRQKGKASLGRHPSSAALINPLKSISELRNKGESRRFLDEVGYLFEGMNRQGSISLRRASALEIITKMCDSEFMRKAKAADFFNRTWDTLLAAECGSGKDKILDILLVIFVAIIARDGGNSLEDLNQHTQGTDRPLDKPDETPSTVVDILFRQLEVTQDDDDPLRLLPEINEASLKEMGLTKRDKPILLSIYDVLTTRSNLVSTETALFTSSLTVYSLRRLPFASIPRQYFPTLLGSFRYTLAFGTGGTSLFTALPKWTATATAVPYESARDHLHLFTAYLMDRWQPSEDVDTPEEDQEERNQHEMDKARDEWLVDDLIALAVCIELQMLSEESDQDTLQESLDLILQALVSLTHHDNEWGRKIVQSEYGLPFLLRMVHKMSQNFRNPFPVKREIKNEEGVDEDMDEQDVNEPTAEQISDTLCLVLGQLTNLVQTTLQSKDMLREIRLDPACPLKRYSCATKCLCPKRRTGLEILVELYKQQTKVETAESFTATPPPDSREAEAEAEASFIRSHLAVLFGLLMMDNPKNRKEILSKLPQPPSSSTRQAKVSKLFEQAQMFLTFYTIVSRRLREDDGESKVAKEVVEFLQRLRDDPDAV
ncbi:hypothetical protein CVT24_011033 [Panaeolus cyanescens]|uniref:Wings apart-like protein C-terminal domain-containing protein n=1 Tax=Panaeolus cyanescens TaxID=181874 RepID=A0A409VFZ6_9AGAR|nr:hypothetical protein CVT24_011033 [Panaeolus cyanescens]